MTAVAAASLLAAPTVLAFFSGGYFTEPRLIAAIVVWALVLALALTGPVPLPRGRAGRLALGRARADGGVDGRVDRLGAARRPRGRRTSSGCCCTPAR